MDMKRLFLLIPALLNFFISSGQDLSLKYAETITAEDLEEHLNILASDALEGRETGERGQKMAAAYLEHYFKTNELDPIVNSPAGNSYLQNVDLVKVQPGKTWVKVDENTYENYIDMVYTGQRNFTEPLKTRIVFAGSGNKKDYEAIDVEGKNVMIFTDGDRIVRNKKSELAMEQGARNVFIIQAVPEQRFLMTLKMYKRYTSSGKLTLAPEERQADAGYFLISQAMAADIMNTSEKNLLSAVDKADEGKYSSLLKLKSKEVTFYANQNIETVQTENVLGFIEGTDKKDEYIVLTAHYDHVGTDGEEVFNGADDDGSGTVAIMEIAQAFAMAKKDGNGPRRSILIMAVSGEEKGLLGSSYYVNNPVLPLEQTITNLNLDMVGRIDDKHEDDPDYIYLIGSDKLSNELHELSEKVNDKYSGLYLDYTYNAPDDPNRFYYRSDHYNFAKNNIPIIFYFNGTHADYHRPTDTVDKIEYELMEKRTRLVFHTAWEIANRDERISVDVLPNDQELDDSN